MILRELPAPALTRRLRQDGLRLRTGPFLFELRSPLPLVQEGIARLYADYPLGADDEYVDYALRIEHGAGWRRWVKPQARFLFDDQQVFEPMPASHAFALLEWSMNWCISTQAHDCLVLHAAVIEREGLAVILPAPPGSGKSTLCAGLIHSGWRLLSDELTLIVPEDRRVLPLCRPVSLKNQSIEVMGNYVPGAVFGRIAHETAKGSVTHMKVPSDHVARMQTPAQPRWVVFPRYVAGAATRLTPRSRAQSLLDLARNAFNYMVLGELGFEVLRDTVAAADCYDFEYSRLDEAVAAFDGLLSGARA